MKRQSAARRRSSEQNSRTNPTEASSLQVSYGECRKNHAATLGGYAVDGCREFMPTSNDVTSPASFFCAACGCHRNFHRPEVEPEVVSDSSSPTSSTYN